MLSYRGLGKESIIMATIILLAVGGVAVGISLVGYMLSALIWR
jgi:hypothetical protein